jgi:hypothetical protein
LEEDCWQKEAVVRRRRVARRVRSFVIGILMLHDTAVCVP